MKKVLIIFMAGMLLGCLGACGSQRGLAGTPSVSADAAAAVQPAAETEEQSVAAAAEPDEFPKSLVVYFSATGSTKSVAETLAEMKGADLYEIVPEQPYTDQDLNYNDKSSRTSAEQNDEAARPAISGGIDNLGDYDVVYVGFPIWWGGMPRILYTFFDTYDLSGKTIAPFCTSGGSGISEAVRAIEELEESAMVTEGLRTETSHAETDLEEWLEGLEEK
ncbi:hypothetical protein GPL15_01140 [Clostridium sp. MCC353]|uniref:flavodoxin n=1 Tax=Clostridium sp. MCC353 TaxID=2592646 RepID=UPI001C00E8BB|nr:flavodoxin [Clostridium sp. MCC353]MBT9775114.1 hypothetical protein [Clostridium sp. MCC353]